ncbi:lantibiotic dehydratase [Actinomycetes bacterium KLBMP 9759]
MRMMIRTAAVPVAALADLRYDKTWPSVARAAELDCWLRAEGRQLADELHAVIGGVTGPARGELVALRRAVYGQRRPSARAWNAEVRAHLTADLAERVSLWVLRNQLHRDLMAELPITRQREDAVVTARLREHLRAPAYRFGLAQGSPVLSEQLGKWLDDQGAPPQRQSVLRLVKYLARAAAKTSPYSTFTVSGLVPAAEGTGLLRTTGELRWTSAVELNIWLARRIVHALATSARFKGSLQIRPNPSLVRDDARYRFLSVADGAAVAGMRSGPALEACLDRAGDPAGCTVDELCAHLQELDGSLDPAAVRHFVDRVVEAGPLCLRMPFPDQVDGHLAALADWLADAGSLTPQEREVMDGARALHAALAAYPALDDVRARERARAAVGARVAELLHRTGAPDPEQVPRKNVFHENAVFAEPPAGFAPQAWRPLADDLGTVRKLLCAVDPAVSIRAAVSDVFVDRYGEGGRTRWLDFYQYLNEAMANGCAVLSGPELTSLRDGPTMAVPQAWWTLPYAREQAARIDTVTELIFSRASARGPTVMLTERELDERLGFDAGPTDSMACYGHLADLGEPAVASDAPSGFVLNGVISGYGRGLSKVHRTLCQAGVADRFPEWRTTERVPGGELLVELDSLFGSNLNLRSRATRYELDYPLTTPGRDPADRIALSDVEVVHEPGSGRLRLRAGSTGEWLRPMHGGLMATYWLPEPLRNLITLFGPTHTLMHSAIPLFLPRGRDVMAGGIRPTPRIRIGDVVLSRRSWVVPAPLVPRRNGGESDESFWVRLAGWHREHGLPERYYARSAELSSVTWDPTQKSRKPMFVDLASWQLVALLERIMGGPAGDGPPDRAGRAGQPGMDGVGGMLVLTEALPEPAASPAYGRDRHVTELVVELPGDPGGPGAAT